MTTEYSVGELARTVTTVAARIEGVVTRLESGQFVRADIFELAQKGQDQTNTHLDGRIKDLDKSKVGTESFVQLQSRVQKLEDTNTWLTRLVLGFIVLGILTFVYTVTGGKT